MKTEDGINKKLIAGMAGLFLVTACALLALFDSRTHKSMAAVVAAAASDWYVYAPIIMRDGTQPPAMPSDGVSSWGAPIATSPYAARGSVWVVNPDAGSVTMIDDSFEKVAEVPVGQEPCSVAISPDGTDVYVVVRAAGTLVVVDAGSHIVRATVPIGPEPSAVALSPTGSRAYVTVTSR